jgi:hypothetical protein
MGRWRLIPPLRQQPLQLAHRHGGDAGQHTAEVGLGVDAMSFGAGDEAVERGGALGGFVVSGEEPVLSADADPPQGAFGGVVVDVEEALRGVDAQCLPLVEHVGHGLRHGAARQDQLLLGVQPRLDCCQDRHAQILLLIAENSLAPAVASTSAIFASP